MKMKRLLLFLLLAFSVIFFSGCLDDEEEALTNLVEVPDQVISQNLVFIQSLQTNEDGWIVVHADNGSDAPVTPDIISEPVSIPQSGLYQNVGVELTPEANLVDGSKFWVMLHQDTGTEDEYEFDGQNGLDSPLMQDGNIVMDNFAITAPEVVAVDQAVTDNQVTIENAVIGRQGWVVMHLVDDQGNPAAVVGQTLLQQSQTSDVVVDLDDTQTYNSGDELIAMLHIDAEPFGVFNFPGGDDVPEVFGFDANDDPVVVLTRFTVQ